MLRVELLDDLLRRALRRLVHAHPPAQRDQRGVQAGVPVVRGDAAGAGQLVVHRVEHEQRLAPLGRGEQRGQEAVGVVAADDLAGSGQHGTGDGGPRR